MSLAPPRSRDQRRSDTLALLKTPAIDVWVATASIGEGGRGAEGLGGEGLGGGGTALPYLVPVSLAWLDERVVIAIPDASPTARNLVRSRTARLGVGPTRDVVMIDARLEDSVAVPQAPAALAGGYAAQADWDPREAGDGYSYHLLQPVEIRAWREANEIRGRLLMRNGRWL